MTGLALCGPVAGWAQDVPGLRTFVEAWCADCHGAGKAKGDLDLEALLGEPPGGHTGQWEKVARRLSARQMPPPDEERPDEKEYRRQVAALEAALDAQAALSPDPGKVAALRRLTRTEYRNAVRDLLGVEIEVAELLPKDESSLGFDNITVGDLSPTLLNRYITAAQKISRVAAGGGGGAQVRILRVPADRTQEERVAGLPPGTRGGVLFAHTFPASGEYEVEVLLTRDRNDELEGLREPHEMEVLVDGETLARWTVEPPSGRNHTVLNRELRGRILVTAGSRQVGVTFHRKGASLQETKRQPYDAAFNLHRHPRQSPAVYQVAISGPFRQEPEGKTAGLLPGRRPAAPEEEPACAAETISALMEQAWRRPVTAEEVAGPLAFYTGSRAAGGSYAEGLGSALSAILVSPRFLFRIEEDPPGLAPGSVYPLDGLALASRLSFFLWSSLPDADLRAAALAGTLTDPAGLEHEVRRMLADANSSALITNFANQWLQLRNLDTVSPDLRQFPDFDDNLRQAFREETERFMESIVREDRPVADLLAADYSWLNERLARHYGIPHVQGSRFRRVHLGAETHRGGLLRHGSILTVTSYADRTSPVLRGNWILNNILGTPTPPPPPNIPALGDAVVDASLPMRQRLGVHREDKSCAVCHDLMDPLGFSLENYDAVGRWREREGEVPVDASGGSPDGRTFGGVAGLEQALRDRPDLFARTVTEKLLTYALGRGLEPADAPAVRAILAGAAEGQYRFSDLILGLVKSVPFTHRKSS